MTYQLELTRINSAVKDAICILNHYQSRTDHQDLEERRTELSTTLMLTIDSFNTYLTNQDYFEHKSYARWIAEAVLQNPELSYFDLVQKMMSTDEITEQDFIQFYRSCLDLSDLKTMKTLLNGKDTGKPEEKVVQNPDLNRVICEYINLHN